MDVRLKREDWGLAIGAALAVLLIGGFLVATSGSSEEADAGPTTTEAPAAPRTGVVRVTSEADPEREWADARGVFRPGCEEGRMTFVDARATRLPPDLRYGWRLITGEEDGDLETAPLTDRPGISTDVVQGDGLASAFRATGRGSATVRFSFALPRRDLFVGLGLTVLGVAPDQALVLRSPELTCREAD